MYLPHTAANLVLLVGRGGQCCSTLFPLLSFLKIILAYGGHHVWCNYTKSLYTKFTKWNFTVVLKHCKRHIQIWRSWSCSIGQSVLSPLYSFISHSFSFRVNTIRSHLTAVIADVILKGWLNISRMKADKSQ